MDNKFFDAKMKVLVYIWIMNCLVIIFAKYSVMPETYCYIKDKLTYCNGRRHEK
jgi:hypothetical protein